VLSLTANSAANVPKGVGAPKEKTIMAHMAHTKRAFDWKSECGGLPTAQLSVREKERIQRRLKKLRYPNPGDLNQWERFRNNAIAIVRSHLSSPVRDLLIRFTQDQRQPGFVIDGLPVGDLPATPPDGQRPADKSAVSEAVILGTLFYVGDLLSYYEEKGGAPIHEVVPISGLEMSQSNAGRSRFRLHVDDYFLDSSAPDGLNLFGLRNDQATATRVLPLDDILRATPARLLKVLRRRAWRISPPESFALERQYLSPPMPIIWTDKCGINRIGWPSTGAVPVDAEAEAAEIEFRDLVESLQPRLVVLRPGHLLCFRNSLALHGRDEVIGDRWLQRAYWKATAARLRELTGSDSRAFAFSVYQLLGF
jgi:hypothetical protein